MDIAVSLEVKSANSQPANGSGRRTLRRKRASRAGNTSEVDQLLALYRGGLRHLSRRPDASVVRLLPSERLRIAIHAVQRIRCQRAGAPQGSNRAGAAKR